MRRLWEEKDQMQAYNAGKYLTTIVAICTRTAYALYSGIGWKISAVVSSAIAAIYGTYWDIVIDWGLLCKNSNNAFLRDKLLLPHKTIYIVAMILNVLLRFAWLQTVLGIKVPYFHRETVITIFASLEIVRRGIWNFFRYAL